MAELIVGWLAEEVAILDCKLVRMLVSGQDGGIISVINRIFRISHETFAFIICRYIYIFTGTVLHSGLEMTSW